MGRDMRQSIATKWQLGKRQKTVSSSQRGHVSQKDLDRANKYIENVRGLGRNWAIHVKKLESKYPKNVIKVYHELQVDVQEANRKKAEKKQAKLEKEKRMQHREQKRLFSTPSNSNSSSSGSDSSDESKGTFASAGLTQAQIEQARGRPKKYINKPSNLNQSHQIESQQTSHEHGNMQLKPDDDESFRYHDDSTAEVRFDDVNPHATARFFADTLEAPTSSNLVKVDPTNPTRNGKRSRADGDASAAANSARVTQNGSVKATKSTHDQVSTHVSKHKEVDEQPSTRESKRSATSSSSTEPKSLRRSPRRQGQAITNSTSPRSTTRPPDSDMSISTAIESLMQESQNSEAAKADESIISPKQTTTKTASFTANEDYISLQDSGQVVDLDTDQDFITSINSISRSRSKTKFCISKTQRNLSLKQEKASPTTDSCAPDEPLSRVSSRPTVDNEPEVQVQMPWNVTSEAAAASTSTAIPKIASYSHEHTPQLDPDIASIVAKPDGLTDFFAQLAAPLIVGTSQKPSQASTSLTAASREIVTPGGETCVPVSSSASGQVLARHPASNEAVASASVGQRDETLPVKVTSVAPDPPSSEQALQKVQDSPVPQPAQDMFTLRAQIPLPRHMIAETLDNRPELPYQRSMSVQVGRSGDMFSQSQQDHATQTDAYNPKVNKMTIHPKILDTLQSLGFANISDFSDACMGKEEIRLIIAAISEEQGVKKPKTLAAIFRLTAAVQRYQQGKM